MTATDINDVHTTNVPASTVPAAFTSGDTKKKAKNGIIVRTIGDGGQKLICTGPIAIEPVKVFDSETRTYVDEMKRTDDGSRVLWRAKSGLLFTDRDNTYDFKVTLSFATLDGEYDVLRDIADLDMGELYDLDGRTITMNVWLFRGNEKEKPAQGVSIVVEV